MTRLTVCCSIAGSLVYGSLDGIELDSLDVVADELVDVGSLDGEWQMADGMRLVSKMRTERPAVRVRRTSTSVLK